MSGTRADGLSRRRFLTGSAALGGAAAAGGLVLGRASAGQAPASPASAPADLGQARLPFFGVHQSGLEQPPQAVAAFLAFDLRDDTDRDGLVGWMRLWTDDAARLTQGRAALADTEPELAEIPARLSATVGFGPKVLDAAGLPDQRPDWLAPLPAFPIDRLQPSHSDGDVLLALAGDDPVTLAHAQRMMVKDARAFADVRWIQSGFHRAAGTTPSGTTGRNLMGQVDGTVNPQPGTPAFAEAVWVSDGPEWMIGGTGLAFRRIRMELDTWDALDRSAKEQVIGRRLDSGAPLTGSTEQDVPDLAATGPDGLLVIPEFAHIRQAHAEAPSGQILRRPYNYDDGVLADGRSDTGLLFTAYAADLDRQFVPMQRRLAEVDLLNQWTTPVGSAVFAILPGVAEGSYFAEALLG